jgi:hypothetical protein
MFRVLHLRQTPQEAEPLECGDKPCAALRSLGEGGAKQGAIAALARSRLTVGPKGRH